MSAQFIIKDVSHGEHKTRYYTKELNAWSPRPEDAFRFDEAHLAHIKAAELLKPDMTQQIKIDRVAPLLPAVIQVKADHPVRKRKPLTNVQCLEKMMEFSKVGALKQAFIMQAIETYAKQQIADTSVWPAETMISQKAWKKAAQECLDELDAHYERNAA